MTTLTRRVSALGVGLISLALAAPVPVRAQTPAPAPTPPAPTTPVPTAPAPVVRPITLAEALTLAAQNNLGLRVAAYESQVARSQLAQAEAFRRGLLTGNAQYTRVNERPPTTITVPNPPGPPLSVTIPAPDPNLWSLGVTYQLPLYTGGRSDAQIALARANLRGAESALERIKQQLVLDVRQAYYGLLLAQAGIGVSQRAVASAEENLRVARARVQAGASPRFDEVQAEVSLANARQALVRARASEALAIQGVDALLALPLDTALQPRETMTVVALRGDLPALIRRALETRPELAEHMARVAAAQAAVEIARAGARPLIVLNAGPTYGTSSGGSFTGGSTAALTWSVTLSGTITLSDGNLTAERIREAQLRVEQLRATEAQIRQVIELDVRRAVINYASAVEEVVAADKSVEQGQEQLRIANVRFQAGVSTNLEVVTAQSLLSQAELSRVQAIYSVNVARAQLERAVGAAVE
jgi:outer membrane protein TolC